MSGFIALTTPDWITSIKSTNGQTAVFWRKKRYFKALVCGERMYFLQRGSFSSNDNRYIVGSGMFLEQKQYSAEDAWDSFGELMGFPDKKLFTDSVRKMYKEKNPQLSCLILGDVKFYRKPVSLSDAHIDFSPYIVSGKTISEAECASIEKCACISD